MRERINWVDWAKCLAVMTVVFCHLPQSQEWMYFRYLQTCIITIFFFVSGYLKRDRGSMAANWRKYWWGLIVPYALYNIVMLPYWVVRYYLKMGGWPDGAALAKPVIGALLMEHEGSWAEALNGTLWYLPALLLMHLLADLCHHTRHEHLLMTGLCLMSCVGYYLYRYYDVTPSLTPVGFIREFPFYYFGYLAVQSGLLRQSAARWRDGLLCGGFLILSVWLFYWHVDVRWQLPLHLTLFYAVNAGFLLGGIFGCKLLESIATPRWVTNLSIGTLVIIGLQWMVIGAVNYVMTQLTGFRVDEGYTWWQALLLTLGITALLYPLIPAARQYAQVALGKAPTHATSHRT